MANSSGHSSRRLRSRTNGPALRRNSRKCVAAPDTTNSSVSRQGEVSIISGSIASDAYGLLM